MKKPRNGSTPGPRSPECFGAFRDHPYLQERGARLKPDTRIQEECSDGVLSRKKVLVVELRKEHTRRVDLLPQLRFAPHQLHTTDTRQLNIQSSRA